MTVLYNRLILGSSAQELKTVLMDGRQIEGSLRWLSIMGAADNMRRYGTPEVRVVFAPGVRPAKHALLARRLRKIADLAGMDFNPFAPAAVDGRLLLTTVLRRKA